MQEKKIYKWVDLPLAEFHTKRKAIIRGNEVEVFVSPYDIPKAIRAVVNMETSSVTFEFKYLNEEPTETKTASTDGSVKYELGKSSKRIYAITFDTKNFRKPGNVKLSEEKVKKLLNAINLLLAQASKETPKDNYELVQDAVKAEESAELFAAV